MEKRYKTYNKYLRNRFDGQKIIKVSLNAGFTCPNIDGKRATGGCIFCSIKGSGDFAGHPSDDLVTQFNEIKDMQSKKWPNGKYIAYFQAFTNTYAPVEVLREKYETVLNIDGVVGLSIATRADCLDDDIIEYLSELNKRTYLSVELGLQSSNDKTAKLINRAHSYEEYKQAVNKLREHDIEVVCHVINGLPGEDKNMMIQTIKDVSKLDIQMIKIHLLHVLINTPIENMLEKRMFNLLELDEYLDILREQISYLRPDIIIQRLTGDGKRSELIGPTWSLKKWEVLNAIDRTLEENNITQGMKWEKTQ